MIYRYILIWESWLFSHDLYARGIEYTRTKPHTLLLRIQSSLVRYHIKTQYILEHVHDTSNYCLKIQEYSYFLQTKDAMSQNCHKFC